MRRLWLIGIDAIWQLRLGCLLIGISFNREGSPFLACNENNAFLLLNNLNDISCGHVRICLMFSIIFYINKIWLEII